MTGRHPVLKERCAIIESVELFQQAKLCLLVSVNFVNLIEETLKSLDSLSRIITLDLTPGLALTFEDNANRLRFESTPTTPHPGNVFGVLTASFDPTFGLEPRLGNSYPKDVTQDSGLLPE